MKVGRSKFYSWQVRCLSHVSLSGDVNFKFAVPKEASDWSSSFSVKHWETYGEVKAFKKVRDGELQLDTSELLTDMVHVYNPLDPSVTKELINRLLNRIKVAKDGTLLRDLEATLSRYSSGTSMAKEDLVKVRDLLESSGVEVPLDVEELRRLASEGRRIVQQDINGVLKRFALEDGRLEGLLGQLDLSNLMATYLRRGIRFEVMDDGHVAVLTKYHMPVERALVEQVSGDFDVVYSSTEGALATLSGRLREEVLQDCLSKIDVFDYVNPGTLANAGIHPSGSWEEFVSHLQQRNYGDLIDLYHSHLVEAIGHFDNLSWAIKGLSLAAVTLLVGLWSLTIVKRASRHLNSVVHDLRTDGHMIMRAKAMRALIALSSVTLAGTLASWYDLNLLVDWQGLVLSITTLCFVIYSLKDRGVQLWPKLKKALTSLKDRLKK